MINKIIDNVFSSALEKVFIITGNFLASILHIRYLTRSDFGILGIVAGYYAFVNIINVSLESIILRDHGLYEENLSSTIYNFQVFNFLKSVVFIVIGFVLAYLLSGYYTSINFTYAIAALTTVLILDSFTAPLSVYASSQYKQRLVVYITMIRQTLSLFLLCGIILFPTIKYLFFKELVLALIVAPLWVSRSRKNLNIKFAEINPIKDLNFSFIKKAFFSYSLYTHFSGVITNFIYKSDTFFLSFFTGLQSVGNYTIALNSANMANTVSAIMGYQNSVAISNINEKTKIQYVTNNFIRISFYLAVVTALFYIFLGKYYIILVTGSYNEQIYLYMLMIVFSLLIVKTLSGPLTAFINIKGSVKELFYRVLIPLFIITAVTYYLGARFYGPLGTACANIFNAVIWILLLVREIKKYGYSFRGVLNVKNDLVFIREYLHQKKFADRA